MGLVIDTNVFIDAENGRFDLAALNDYTAYGEAFIAAITVSELLTGVHMAKSTAIRIRRSAFVEGVLSGVPALDFTEEVARTYAELYAHFLKKRTKPSSTVHDLQIAATAITYGYAVLTSNVSDFKKVPGLIVECPK
ncbi:type II toxin-antitoxin system VapC family toxin [Porticoccaceae bacterium]|nr:type II toxin-antitoxin system VapC family toxin [Porticoccaceae bacterium]MDC0003482.1 type II toxin-antitoxin system VapC family toxin [Porticoccaceae bacterium]